MEFKNKVVWITGASAGIGRALAHVLGGKGARLVLSARRERALNGVRDEIGRGPDDVFVLPLDLADLESLPGRCAEVLNRFGTIDVLVNNGGISQRSLVRETTLQVDQEIMTVNYMGQIALTKAILPHMLKKNEGCIVVVSSIMGKFSTPLRSAYCASKHALHGFFDALRAEVWEDNIRVVIICPASIRTDISMSALVGGGSTYGKMDEQQAKGMPVEKCAMQMVRAMEKEREEVWVGPPVKYVALVKRFVPGLFSRAIRRAKVT